MPKSRIRKLKKGKKRVPKQERKTNKRVRELENMWADLKTHEAAVQHVEKLKETGAIPNDQPVADREDTEQGG